jgi:protein-S-isoprenylcysteine O-methyltransferase Ste14
VLNHGPIFVTRAIAASTLVLLASMVLARVWIMKRRGMRAMHFGQIDKKDFLIPPFALFYFYTVFAAAFGWPEVYRGQLFGSEFVAWVGVVFCLGGVLLLAWSLASFGRSFRVGIDTEQPDKLVTTGIFAVTRNPIYVAFGFVLVGEFLIFPNWILLLYLCGASWLIHRQVLLEENYLRQHYGEEYVEYCRRVRRYF